MSGFLSPSFRVSDIDAVLCRRHPGALARRVGTSGPDNLWARVQWFRRPERTRISRGRSWRGVVRGGTKLFIALGANPNINGAFVSKH